MLTSANVSFTLKFFLKDLIISKHYDVFLAHVWYDDRYWSKLLHSTFHTYFHDLKVNVTDLEPIGRADSIVDHPSSRPYIHTCVRPYVRKPFLVITSPRPLVGFFETCLGCSPSGAVVHARKWFRSVDKYGCRRPYLILTVIASTGGILSKSYTWIPLNV